MEKNLNERLIIIGAVVLLGLWMLYPPTKRLRAGLDIAGGTSMIFEIDDTDLRDHPNLAEEMKTLLQKRVDPTGVSNIVWRVHGRNRLEVQMPLPPKKAEDLRQAYIKDQDELFKASIRRSELEKALREAEPQRSATLAALAQQADIPVDLLQAAAVKADAYARALAALQAARPTAADPAASAPNTDELESALRDADEQLDDAIRAALDRVIDPARFKDVLEMEPTSKVRQNSLAELEQKHPALKARIEKVLASYAEWRANRGFLDGPADLRRLLRGAGVLEYRILAAPNPDNPTEYERYREQLHKYGPRVQSNDTAAWFRIDNPVAFFNLDSTSQLATLDPRHRSDMIVDKYNDQWFVLASRGPQYEMLGDAKKAWSLKRAFPGRDQQGKPCVHFEFDARGGDMFRSLTGPNVNRQLCIFVDGVAYSAANIQQAIGSQGQITGNFNQEKVKYIVSTMQAGALPARLKDTPISERTIGSSLGAENLRKALNSGIIGAVAVAVLMIGYYRTCGVIAVIAVFMNVFLTLAVMAMLQAKFTLDGIAGLVLSVGMAVDANVLIHERMREEQERGASLRAAIKSGYDRAFRAIFDGHVTTLLTSVIIYYVGSEEIRGFGLILGWGIILSLFTSVFVTRTLLMLLVKNSWITQLNMMKLIKAPHVDWYGLRRIFLPISAVLTVVGLLLMGYRSPKDYLDIEFLGGTTATLELKKAGMTYNDLHGRLQKVGKALADEAQKLSSAAIEPVAGDATLFVVRVPGADASSLAAFLSEPLEEANLIVRNGVEKAGGRDAIRIRTKPDVTADQLTSFVRGLARDSKLSADNIGDAVLGEVLETSAPGERGKLWEITSTATNRGLVQRAIVQALGDELLVQQRLQYTLHLQNDRPYPITDKRLEAVIPVDVLPPNTTADLTDYVGGAAMFFDQIDPPQTLDALTTRLRSMRLQPGFGDVPWRPVGVIGLKPAGTSDGKSTFSSVVVVVADQNFAYQDDADRWFKDFARKELDVARLAFETEQALQKISQFKPQIAAQSQTRAIVAIVLSWAMIIGYLWVRFGSVAYGVAGVIGLVHTVLISLALVSIAGSVGGAGTFLGEYLLIDNFKINMTIIAALLTLIGYAINDTIVNFDRVREIRGRLGVVTPEVINRAINECMSRTILTGTTVLMVLLAMYIFGGSTLRGFNFCMLVGVICGTYSSVAIATPLLLVRYGGTRQPSAARRPATA